MEKNNSSAKDLAKFLENLFLLFLGLKLAGFIEWSWVWVCSPIWIPTLIVLLVVTGGVIYAMASKKNKR